MCFWKSSSPDEKLSPSDIMHPDGILHMSETNEVVIRLEKLNIGLKKPPKVFIPGIPDTGSMDPVFDAEHNNILIAGADDDDHYRLICFIKPGDIIVYELPGVCIIHRVVKIEQDGKGRKFICKGDNNPRNDSHEIRDENVKWLSIGTIY